MILGGLPHLPKEPAVVCFSFIDFGGIELSPMERQAQKSINLLIMSSLIGVVKQITV